MSKMLKVKSCIYDIIIHLNANKFYKIKFSNKYCERIFFKNYSNAHFE